MKNVKGVKVLLNLIYMEINHNVRPVSQSEFDRVYNTVRDKKQKK